MANAQWVRFFDDLHAKTQEGGVAMVTRDVLAAAAAYVRELEADKRRLDWIESHTADLVCYFWKPGISIENPSARYEPPHWNVHPDGDCIEGLDEQPSVRAAIDKAITAWNADSHHQSDDAR